MEAESRSIGRLADTPQKPEPRNFIFCKNCGCKLPHDAWYCLYCGTPVQRENLPDRRREKRNRELPVPRKKKNSPLLVILLILALLVIFIDGYILCTKFVSSDLETETWSFLPDPSDSAETASAVQNDAVVSLSCKKPLISLRFQWFFCISGETKRITSNRQGTFLIACPVFRFFSSCEAFIIYRFFVQSIAQTFQKIKFVHLIA